MKKTVQEKVNKRFYATVDITVSVTMPIVAASLEEVLEKAKTLTVTDIITIEDDSEYVDYAIEVSGVFR